MIKSFFSVDDNFESIIKTFFSHAKSIEQIKTGWTNFVFIVKVKNSNYIFRFPRNNFFAKAIIKEVDFNNNIKKQLKYTIPKLSLYYFEGKPFSVHKAIKGNSLTDCYKNITFLQQQKLCKQIVDFIFDFQKIKPKQSFQTVSNFLNNLVVENNLDFDLTKLSFLKKLESKNCVVCHGDLNPGNILLKNNKIVGIIDFAFAGVSIPEQDISRMICRLPDNYKNILIDCYNKKFNKKLNLKLVDKLCHLWNDIEFAYINYIKIHHRDIVLPN